MKKYILPLTLTFLILGCSSSQTANVSERFNSISGGQSVGDTTSFYWYTERLDFPYSAADFVASGDYGWYQSDYRWRESVVREIVRKGMQRQPSGALAPFTAHLRFNNDGEAVYQQYRIDGKVLPMPTEQIERLLTEALSIQNVTKSQKSSGSELIQGYWDGEIFTSCTGNEYDNIEFNQTLPTFVINRLASLDSYAAFVGSTPLGKIVVKDLLMLEEESYDCVERPVFIEGE